MEGLNILFGLCICCIVCTCIGSYVHTMYQSNSVFSERQIMRFARTSNDLKYCGTRINEANFSRDPLVATDWCETGIREPGYKYLLKSVVKVTQLKSWGFSSRIPVCSNGSSIEILLTPNTGWTTIGLKVFNTTWKVILYIPFLQSSGELVANVQASIKIEIKPDSFSTYINNEEYQQTLYPDGIPSYSMFFQIHPAPADIHMVRYTAAPDDP